MNYFMTFLLPLTLAIIIHEAGHYFVARHYGVGVARASLFFNFIVTFIKYDPLSGRLSIISRQEPLTITDANGLEHTVRSEWAFLSIPLRRPFAPDSTYDSATNEFVPLSGILLNTTVIKTRCASAVANWRNTQYCLGWIPCGGYVSLNTTRDAGSMLHRTNGQQLAINVAGVVCNLLTVIITLSALRWAVSFHSISYWFNVFRYEAFLLAYYSFVLLCLNVLPLPGLDGGNIARNITAMVMPGHESNVSKTLYNIFGWIVFFIIVSSWIRPASGIEQHIFGFFNFMFDKVAALFGFA